MAGDAGGRKRPTFAEEWLVAVLDSLDESVIALDEKGGIVAANPAAEKLFAFVVGDWRGRPFDDLEWGFHGQGDVLVDEDDPVTATLRDHEPRRREIVATICEGRRRWLSVSTRYLPEDVTDGPGVVVAATEITDLIRAEEALRDQLVVLESMNEELRRADAMKGDFLAMASDELRTPTASLLGFVEMLDDAWHDVDDEERRRLVAAMRVEARHLSRVVGDLLVASRLQGEKLQPEIVADVQVADVVDRALREIGAVPDVVDVAADLRARVDPHHLRRIVASLADNALKHGARPIELIAYRDGDEVELRICDAGPGIAPDFVPEMFEAFSQGSTGMARRATGVGLGLAIAEGLVRMNGGAIHYEAHEPRGSCLVVRIPAAPSATM